MQSPRARARNLLSFLSFSTSLLFSCTFASRDARSRGRRLGDGNGVMNREFETGPAGKIAVNYRK
jgi:hypothetical protein